MQTDDDVEELQRYVLARTAPAMYVVDEQARVVLSWRAPNGAAETAAEPERGLPPEIETAVRELQWALREGAGAPLVRLLESSYIVRIAPLAGELGTYYAVLVERFRTRDRFSDGQRRYALTNREQQVLERLVDGARTSDIAQLLGIAPSTVTLHVKSIMTKTASRTRAEMLGRIIAPPDGQFRRDPS